MSQIEEMLAAHPHPASHAGDEALDLIHAAADCAACCAACADACLTEPDVEHLFDCIRLNLDCADICSLTASIVARAGHRDRPTLRALLETCRLACRACAGSCEAHGEHMEHCRVCAEACRRCEEACAVMVGALVA
jgi:hypothetical protein